MLFKRFTHICTNIYTFCRNKRKATSLFANKTVLPKKKDLQNSHTATIYANEYFIKHNMSVNQWNNI